MAHIDPTSPEGAAYIADHLGEGHTADDFNAFVEDLHPCGDCGGLFTERSDTGYGENHDRTCRDCCIEANQFWKAA